MKQPAKQSLLPDHVDKTVHGLVDFHAEQTRPITSLEKSLDRMKSALANPRFIMTLASAILAWIAMNAAITAAGHQAVDPPPFFWLQGVVSLLATCTAILILTTQKREDEVASNREKLMLELAVLSEQKSAKIIELLEALRRDHPEIEDRVDHQAGKMSKPADPRKVLEAISQRDKSASKPAETLRKRKIS